VSYRKEHGIYARMFAFWAIFLLVAYGCFHGGGLVDTLNRWMGDSDTELVASVPLVKTLRVSTCIAAGFLLVMAFVIHAVLNRPRIADALIDTENEMVKVTWPTWQEAWQGTIAVAVMVFVLFVFLTVADLGLVALLQSLLGGGA
jgi:preprotein translocase SecE subunit